MARAAKTKAKKRVETLTHEDASRKNIPTAEYEAVLHEKEKSSIRVTYERRNRDLDPQLVWRGKDKQNWSDLVVHAPPLYIQEKVHPKALIDDLRHQAEVLEAKVEQEDHGFMGDLFADFNGLPNEAAKTEFYQHEAHWSNRMILGDSLQVMASLAEREGLRGKVQCIYMDPPYGIKFNSNFQWSTMSSDVSDGAVNQITREPEQVKAFRDTWRDGIHSYLTYLRDRLTVSRDLLTETGSVFVQIGEENVHRVRSVLDEVFGEDNFVSQISSVTTGGLASGTLSRAGDYLLWYAKKKDSIKYREVVKQKNLPSQDSKSKYDQFETSDLNRLTLSKAKNQFCDQEIQEGRIFNCDNIISQGSSENTVRQFEYRNQTFDCGSGNHWKTNPETGMPRLGRADRIWITSKGKLRYIRYFDDYPITKLSNLWTDIGGSVQSRSDPKVYVVQTGTPLVERCILMATDPGDLVLDPTCGSGTTAFVSEQWGRRWITVDTSRVALALARARIMGARHPYYILSDSKEGLQKEAEITHSTPSNKPTTGNLRFGFVYERVPHITLKSIANNSEIDVIWEKYQEKLEVARKLLNSEIGKSWEEWEVPRDVVGDWSNNAKQLHKEWWENRIARQKEVDATIAAKADFEYLYDKPYEDNKKIRVAGPFTVESLSPHRVLTVGADDELIDPTVQKEEFENVQDFVQIILDNLKTAGVQQAQKENKIDFISITPWAGDLVCAEGVYIDESQSERRAAVFVGPEFGTVSRPDLVSAAREASDAGFDVLIACAFNYDAHSTEFEKLGRIPVLKARMNADLHMADDLMNTGKGNLFVIFGEPDIDLLDTEDDQIQVKINGVDVFHPNTGEVRSDGADGIACWFIDTDYNEESFFVRHAYFLGANDPYKSLKTTLKAEVNKEAWETLNSDISRPFDKPKNGRIAVKVINHLGDEVMKVYRV